MAVVATAFQPGTAAAEGGFDSYLDGAANNFQTRHWEDKNLDNADTKTSASHCSRSDGANFVMYVELKQDVSFQPDPSRGDHNLSSCTYQTATGNWGDQHSGKYYNVVHHYSFGYVSADYYNVRW